VLRESLEDFFRVRLCSNVIATNKLQDSCDNVVDDGLRMDHVLNLCDIYLAESHEVVHDFLFCHNIAMLKGGNYLGLDRFGQERAA
jgi:hypothetical protein